MTSLHSAIKTYGAQLPSIEDFLELNHRLHIEDSIGSGAYSKVYSTSERGDVAVKIVPLAVTQEQVDNGDPNTAAFYAEVQLSIDASECKVGTSVIDWAICHDVAIGQRYGVLLLQRYDCHLARYVVRQMHIGRSHDTMWATIAMQQLFKLSNAGILHIDLKFHNIMIDYDTSTLMIDDMRIIDYASAFCASIDGQVGQLSVLTELQRRLPHRNQLVDAMFLVMLLLLQSANDGSGHVATTSHIREPFIRHIQKRLQYGSSADVDRVVAQVFATDDDIELMCQTYGFKSAVQVLADVGMTYVGEPVAPSDDSSSTEPDV